MKFPKFRYINPYLLEKYDLKCGKRKVFGKIVESYNCEISQEAGIYFLFLNNELIYVGKSRNILNRMANRHNIIKNIKGKISVSFIEITDEPLRDYLELFYIHNYEPKFNKSVTYPILPDLKYSDDKIIRID